MSGTGIHWVVETPASTYALGKSDKDSLQKSFPASPINIATAAEGDVGPTGIAAGTKLDNTVIKEQYNKSLIRLVTENDLFGNVDLLYHQPTTSNKPPNMYNVDQQYDLPASSGGRILAWAPNIASPGVENGLNPLRQPESGTVAAKEITDGQGAAFTSPPGGTNPYVSSQAISFGLGTTAPLKIGTFRLGKRTSPL